MELYNAAEEWHRRGAGHRNRVVQQFTRRYGEQQTFTIDACVLHLYPHFTPLWLHQTLQYILACQRDVGHLLSMKLDCFMFCLFADEVLSAHCGNAPRNNSRLQALHSCRPRLAAVWFANSSLFQYW